MDGKEYKVMAQLARESRLTPQDLDKVFVRNNKGALIQLAKTMAADHASQNVRVNTLSPGAVETRRMTMRFGDMATARQISGPLHLLKRLGQPDEIAAAAVFLASDASSFVTGSDLLVDGGYTAV